MQVPICAQRVRQASSSTSPSEDERREPFSQSAGPTEPHGGAHPQSGPSSRQSSRSGFTGSRTT